MFCPYCSSDQHHPVAKTTRESNAIRRSRTCKMCGRTFHTQESLHTASLTVIKANGTKRPFNRASILNSLKEAAGVRSASTPTLGDEDAEDVESSKLLEQLVEDVFVQVYRDAMGQPIPTRQIGLTVMEHLRPLRNQSWNIRFALGFMGRNDLGDGWGWEDASDVRAWLEKAYPEIIPKRYGAGPQDLVSVRKARGSRKGGIVEAYLSTKVRDSVIAACAGRLDTQYREKTGNRVAALVEYELSGQSRVTVGQIAGAVMNNLRNLDEVAYLRYAAGVLDFYYAEDYDREIHHLIRRKSPARHSPESPDVRRYSVPVQTWSKARDPRASESSKPSGSAAAK